MYYLYYYLYLLISGKDTIFYIYIYTRCSLPTAVVIFNVNDNSIQYNVTIDTILVHCGKLKANTTSPH